MIDHVHYRMRGIPRRMVTLCASISAIEIEKRVTVALEKLCEVDGYILREDLNECTINHRIACHLQDQFPEWHVDCEYNRDGNRVKELELPRNSVSWHDTEAKSVFPDIIIHRRGPDGPNLLVIEVKKTSNRSDTGHDYNKLFQYRDVFGYKRALFLRIGTGNDTGKWEFDWVK